MGFQLWGSSSLSRVMECAVMRESTSWNHANGSTPHRLQEAMKLRSTAAVLPPLSLPKNVQLPRPSTISRLARSVAPLSIVTGHGVFLRRSHGSSRRDSSNCSASEVHRDVNERDRILVCVGTRHIPPGKVQVRTPGKSG